MKKSKRLIKKIISFVLAGAVLMPSLIQISYANTDETGCVSQNYLVSAYYSPLPNQRMYIRGSYENDIILNGRGTNGADGTEVYMGLLAAPKSYSYGTKVILPEIGIGTVHDRGGAIVKGSNYDRIDVWMGKGEEGLARALNWGMRFIEGKKCDKSVKIADTLDYTKISGKLPESVESRLIAKSQSSQPSVKENVSTESASKKIVAYKPSIVVNEKYEFIDIPADTGEGDSGENVVKLQMILQNLGYYKSETLSGVYDVNTMEAVFEFQRENSVVADNNELGAGHFGKKTKKALDSYIAKLYQSARSPLAVKQLDIVNSEVINENVDNTVANNVQINNEFSPVSKSEIFASDESMSVKNIQISLKNKTQVQPEGGSSQVASLKPSSNGIKVKVMQ